MLFHFLSSSYKRYHVHFSTPHRCVVFLVTYLFIFLFIYKLINVGLHVVRNASKNGRSAASGFGEKADSVIAVKRNAEFNAAVNATIIYVTTSGCRCIHQLENAVLHIYCSNTNLTANSCWLNSHKE